MKNQKKTDAYKNAIGTMFLLAGAFFICSTLLSMRTVLADPVAPTATTASKLSPARTAAARNTSTARSTVARSTASRTTANTPTRSTASSNRSVKTRSISVRSNDGTVRDVKTATRSVAARANNNNSTMRGISARNTGRVVARTANTSRVSLIGNGLRASVNTNSTISNLTAKLYTGNYSNIIDSTTGLISADAYSNCLESYYTCMDEICTARSDAKGRCSCAGRATNFLEAETALEKANEELISLSGQLALLVSTKGKDVSQAFKLTDAEKVMNCVSYKDAKTVAGTTKDSNGNTVTAETYMREWCRSHMLYSESECSYSTEPSYCTAGGTNGNDFGFNLSEIDGSSSDILASLKAWANAKDLAKQYQNSTGDLVSNYTVVSGVVNGLSGINETVDTSQAALDTLANKWGYELFQYAHNNVCGRVLDSCFNGIYEACGTPPTIRINNSTGGTTTATMCANSASSNCPFNYNSKIAVSSDGEVELSERGSTGTISSSSASCFGYTNTNGDPYASLRGPVADARRSIMQKYLLDANAACDTYGAALKSTAQNINYQKIAAEQALRQKRMDFYNEEESKITSEAITAYANFNECISEIWDCYNENVDEENWSTARIKTYCAQVANVPHCYEPMICKSPIAQFDAIIDVEDKPKCNYSGERDKNDCRNVVTLQEILYGTGAGSVALSVALSPADNVKSIDVRESCLLRALGCGKNNDDSVDNDGINGCLRNFNKTEYTSNSNN